MLITSIKVICNVPEQLGVRPANKSPAQGRKPLPVFLSLPAGVILGIALARLGLADTILGVIL
jgi:hypothetical protein